MIPKVGDRVLYRTWFSPDFYAGTIMKITEKTIVVGHGCDTYKAKPHQIFEMSLENLARVTRIKVLTEEIHKLSNEILDQAGEQK